MQKLRLDVESLAVESFEAVAADAGDGTVQGHLVPTGAWCQANSYRSYCPNTVCTCPPPPMY
jgi:hypothetical protein